MDQFVGIGRNITIADKYFKIYLRDALRPYDLNAAEGIVLLMMYRKAAGTDQQEGDAQFSSALGGNTQDELIKEIHCDKGVMTRTMKTLEEKRFVERDQNPEDSRSYLFSLTAKGDEFRSVMMEVLCRWNTELLRGISKEHLAIVETALEIMANNSTRYYRKWAKNQKEEDGGNQ